LIEQYSQRGKTIVEIGCEKADFLALMCEMGEARGVGIDPSVDPSRVPRHLGDRIELHAEYFSPAHHQLPADLVCCRHALEHIARPLDFMRGIGQMVASNPQAVVFIEVPDTTRVLTEKAFWDIYHEHCSYFTPVSLARLFELSGLEVLELTRQYDDQYLCIAGKAKGNNHGHALEAFETVAGVHAAVNHFETECPVSIDCWHSRMKSFAAQDKHVAIWGAGSKAVAFLSTLPPCPFEPTLVDINPRKAETYLPGTDLKIHPPDYLNRTKPDVVVVMNRIYCNEIRLQLEKMNLAVEVISVDDDQASAPNTFPDDNCEAAKLFE
jgi:hypothetical protein